MEFKFQTENTFQKRCEESARMAKVYPDRIAMIIESSGTRPLDLDKKKFLVPQNLTVAQLIYVVRKRIVSDIQPDEALFFFDEKNTLPPGSATVSSLARNEDGFVYLRVSRESTFG